MSENTQKLSDELKSALKYAKIEIPEYITQNLSKELREYQKEALRHYLLQRQNPRTNHLMFNMATGSGKTLIMAALMLDCYKRGYRNFIFFVNSNAILEKTRANFADKYSNKYLFKENINIESKNVEINVINNLFESKDECINIHFTTIQALFSLFTNERENALSFDDLKDKKLVFLADEAHHLNSDTKNKNQSEKDGWEAIIKKAFESNNENLLFEFSATIPQISSVLEKYKDKIIYEYILKEFCFAGYSKRIHFIKYDSEALEDRFLGAVLCSLYRELLAQEKGIILKPVILFKSESIKQSKENQEKFINFIENLKNFQIENFYKNIDKNELLDKSLKFFKNKWHNSYANNIINFLKNNFKELFILNTNDDKELEKNQILLNSLESIDNHIRVIFAVDKLNEGWDVLNLFDIVRLGDKKTNKATTTKEAQLIGRGARYYPFKCEFNELKFKRKFDNDLENELNAIERLSYHTRNDVEFIKNLNESMNEKGLPVENEKKRVKLIVNDSVKNIIKNNKIYYANNKRIKKGDLQIFVIARDEIEQKLRGSEIQYFSDRIGQEEAFEEREEVSKEIKQEQNSQKLSKIDIDEKYFLKAMNVLNLSFKEINENFDFKGKKDFINNCLKNIDFLFSRKQEFNEKNNLEIAKFILENFKSKKQEIKQSYSVSEFETHKLEIGDRVVFKNDIKDKDKKSNTTEEKNYEWLYHKISYLDSGLESEFLEFIETKKDDINKIFSKWFIIRNDGFDEFKIYDNREDKPTYAVGFEPDFIFFGKKNKSDKFLSIQCFIEAKGEGFAPKDSWKEEFLQSLKGKKLSNKDDKNLTLHLQAMPFFITHKDNKVDKKFSDSFDEFLKP